MWRLVLHPRPDAILNSSVVGYTYSTQYPQLAGCSSPQHLLILLMRICRTCPENESTLTRRSASPQVATQGGQMQRGVEFFRSPPSAGHREGECPALGPLLLTLYVMSISTPTPPYLHLSPFCCSDSGGKAAPDAAMNRSYPTSLGLGGPKPYFTSSTESRYFDTLSTHPVPNFTLAKKEAREEGGGIFVTVGLITVEIFCRCPLHL